MENISAKQIGVATLGLVTAGVALYYLSKDDSVSDLDPKGKHTEEKLIKILEELFLEQTCIYCRNYNLILKMKEAKTFTADLLSQLEVQVKREIEQKQAQVLKSHEGLTESLFEAWVAHYKNNSKLKEQAEALSKLHEDVFTRQQITSLTFENDLPEKLTKELYIQVYRKIWATIRHDLWEEIQKALKQDRVAKLDEKKFDDIYNKVHGTFETIRVEIYELMMMRPQEKDNEAREMMQKAYVTYSTVASVTLKEGEETVRSRWADQVNEAAASHGKYIEDFSKGLFYSGVEKNPRDSREPDEKTNIKGMPGYVQRQSTNLTDDRNVTPVTKKVDKYVNKFLEKARAKKQEKAATEEKKEVEEEKSVTQKLAERQQTGVEKSDKPDDAPKEEPAKVQEKAEPAAEPKKEETAPVAEPKKEEVAPVAEPKKEEAAPVAEPKKEEVAPVAEPKKEEVAPVAEPKKEEAPVAEPKKEEAPVAEAKKEEPKKEEAPVVEAKKEEAAPVSEPKKEETPAK